MTAQDGQSLTTPPLFIIIVTGISGAGRSTAIKCLEDLGLFCIDNLPVRLLWQAIDFIKNANIKTTGFAFGMDNRDEFFAREFPAIRESLKGQYQLEVLFLEAQTEVIAGRYSTTRRKHPLCEDGNTLLEAIDDEIKLLAPVKRGADVVIDTTALSPHDLTRILEKSYLSRLPERILQVFLQSFGFRYGYANGFDTVFDVRFLANPHFVEALQKKTGRDPAVQDFLFKDPTTKEFFQRLDEWLRYLLPLYYAEGKRYLRIGIGCTGGKHRSVGISEAIFKSFAAKPLQNVSFSIEHRDLARE